MSGDNVPENKERGFEWLTKAANQNHAAAQFWVAYAYHMGEGRAQNNELAAQWYLKAANQGVSFAARQLAQMYEQGEGVESDYFQCYVWDSFADRLEGESGYVSCRHELSEAATARAEEAVNALMSRHEKP